MANMVLRKFRFFTEMQRNLLKFQHLGRVGAIQSRNVVTKPSGAVLPEPIKVPFGLFGVIGAVVPGLLIGATISKNMASFLEENDLFVPADDDDDDD